MWLYGNSTGKLNSKGTSRIELIFDFYHWMQLELISFFIFHWSVLDIVLLSFEWRYNDRDERWILKTRRAFNDLLKVRKNYFRKAFLHHSFIVPILLLKLLYFRLPHIQYIVINIILL